jgi:hypothetical protein
MNFQSTGEKRDEIERIYQNSLLEIEALEKEQNRILDIFLQEVEKEELANLRININKQV